MTNLIEETDRQQRRYWRRYLFAFFLVQALLIVRHLFGTVFDEHDLNSRPIGVVVLVVSVALMIVVFVQVTKLGLLMRRVEADPQLKEALIDNELVKWHLAQSWRAGFIGAAVTPLVLLLISSFHPIDDPLLVALATPTAGCGAFSVTYYLRVFGNA